MRTTRPVIVALIAASFLLTVVSGLVLAFPGRLLPFFGIALLTWRSVHEWSALAFTAAVVAHLVLNRSRIVELFGIRERSVERPAIVAPSPGQTALTGKPDAAPQETPTAERHLRMSRRRLPPCGGRRLGGAHRCCQPGPRQVAWLRLAHGQPARQLPRAQHRVRSARSERRRLAACGRWTGHHAAAPRPRRLACPAAHDRDT